MDAPHKECFAQKDALFNIFTSLNAWKLNCNTAMWQLLERSIRYPVYIYLNIQYIPLLSLSPSCIQGFPLEDQSLLQWTDCTADISCQGHRFYRVSHQQANRIVRPSLRVDVWAHTNSLLTTLFNWQIKHDLNLLKEPWWICFLFFGLLSSVHIYHRSRPFFIS